MRQFIYLVVIIALHHEYVGARHQPDWKVVKSSSVEGNDKVKSSVDGFYAIDKNDTAVSEIHAEDSTKDEVVQIGNLKLTKGVEVIVLTKETLEKLKQKAALAEHDEDKQIEKIEKKIAEDAKLVERSKTKHKSKSSKKQRKKSSKKDKQRNTDEDEDKRKIDEGEDDEPIIPEWLFSEQS